MWEMYKMMRYHSRIGCGPITFTRDELYDLMQRVWPYVSKSPLHRHFPTTAVWAQYTRKHNATEENTSSIVSTTEWRTEYDDGIKVQRRTIRWAVHLPPHYRGHGDSQ